MRATAAVIPVVKGAETARKGTNALTGDIYTRSWTDVRGKGKKRRTVEHTVHVNPLTLVVAAVGAGVAVAAGAVGLWVTQQKVGKVTDAAGSPISKKKTRYARLYAPVYETVTVTDVPGHFETRYDHFGAPHQVWIAPVTHTEQRLKTASRCVVYSNYMTPIRTKANVTDFQNIPWVSKHEADTGWSASSPIGAATAGTDQLGQYTEYAVLLVNSKKAVYGLSQRKGLLEGGL